jgi:hypothetical protein
MSDTVDSEHPRDWNKFLTLYDDLTRIAGQKMMTVCETQTKQYLSLDHHDNLCLSVAYSKRSKSVKVCVMDPERLISPRSGSTWSLCNLTNFKGERVEGTLVLKAVDDLNEGIWSYDENFPLNLDRLRAICAHVMDAVGN